MTKLILSTSNLINGAASFLRRPATEKSNIELVNGLRSNFLASKQEATPLTNGTSDHPDQQQSVVRTESTFEWVTRDTDKIYVPSLDTSPSGLPEIRPQYEITVKLFFLRDVDPSRRRQHVNESVALVLKQLRVPSIDLLIVSFPGISYDKNEKGCTDGLLGLTKDDDFIEDMGNMLETWRALEELQERGLVLRLGIAEFCEEKLQRFLPQTHVRPSVDQINLRDICLAPKALLDYTKQEKIEVWTHSDCTNILPSGTLRELLGTGKNGAGLILGANESGEGLKGDIRPQWVIKYTAVVRDRGVIEDKGYFAMAEIGD